MKTITILGAIVISATILHNQLADIEDRLESIDSQINAIMEVDYKER